MQTEVTAYDPYSRITEGLRIQSEGRSEEQEEFTAERHSSYAKPEGLASVDAQTFRSVLATFGSGVTVVTLCYEKRFYGLTVSSFCSLSLDPPLVLVCVDQRCQCHELIQRAQAFAVNILAEGGEWLARRFASRSDDKFARIPYHEGKMAAPLLDDALATIECRLVHQFPGGDHSIFVGHVMAATIAHDVQPLLYYRSHFYRLVR